MTPLQVAVYAAEVCAAVSAVALVRRRPEYAPAAIALAALAVLDLVRAPIVAALAPMPRPVTGAACALVYLDGGLSLAAYAVVAGLAVAIAVTRERRRFAVALIAGAWLGASIMLGAAYPSPLVRGAGLQRVYFAADLFGLFVSTGALITWARATIAAKQSPDGVSAVALSLVTFDAAILLAPFSPWRGDLFAAPYTGPQLVSTALFAMIATAQVTAWKLSPGSI